MSPPPKSTNEKHAAEYVFGYSAPRGLDAIHPAGASVFAATRVDHDPSK
jgi:hypothetical protein